MPFKIMEVTNCITDYSYIRMYHKKAAKPIVWGQYRATGY